MVKDTVHQGVWHPQATAALSGQALPEEPWDSRPHSPRGHWWDLVSVAGPRELAVFGAPRHAVLCHAGPREHSAWILPCKRKEVTYVSDILFIYFYVCF